jgi:hypothetical protein
MADFIRERADFPHREFAAELATLEWAMVEVLHGASPEALDLEHLQAYPFEKWAEARFERSSTSRVLRFEFPANRFYQAFRNDEAPAVPERSATATAVYRDGYTIWRMDLTPAMRDLLEALLGGAPLGQALSTLELPADDPVALSKLLENAMIWFKEWVGGGVFSSITVE